MKAFYFKTIGATMNSTGYKPIRHAAWFKDTVRKPNRVNPISGCDRDNEKVKESETRAALAIITNASSSRSEKLSARGVLAKHAKVSTAITRDEWYAAIHVWCVEYKKEGGQRREIKADCTHDRSTSCTSACTFAVSGSLYMCLGSGSVHICNDLQCDAVQPSDAGKACPITAMSFDDFSLHSLTQEHRSHSFFGRSEPVQTEGAEALRADRTESRMTKKSLEEKAILMEVLKAVFHQTQQDSGSKGQTIDANVIEQMVCVCRETYCLLTRNMNKAGSYRLVYHTLALLYSTRGGLHYNDVILIPDNPKLAASMGNPLAWKSIRVPATTRECIAMRKFSNTKTEMAALIVGLKDSERLQFAHCTKRLSGLLHM